MVYVTFTTVASFNWVFRGIETEFPGEIGPHSPETLAEDGPSTKETEQIMIEIELMLSSFIEQLSSDNDAYRWFSGIGMSIVVN